MEQTELSNPDRIAILEARVSLLASSLETAGRRIEALSARLDRERELRLEEQRTYCRRIDQQVARANEVASRLGQRVARCEGAIDLLARGEAHHAIDHA